ncbi:MAG: DUF4160 domain-containing protein [Dehalococcoidia bacterium]|nr:DUF4160 domain-containing protein [Dehalococcoidia bacterium]
MPEMARFDGIVILMHFGDHAPPHFHVRHGGNDASVTITPLEILAGALPLSVWRRVREWAEGREAELLRTWDSLRGGGPR